jgi:hypothetical protein
MERNRRALYPSAMSRLSSSVRRGVWVGLVSAGVALACSGASRKKVLMPGSADAGASPSGGEAGAGAVAGVDSGGGGGGGGGGEAGVGAGGGAAGVEDSGAGGSPTPVSVDPACKSIAPDATLTAHLRITADNTCEVFVNGVSVGSTDNWAVAVTIDVSLFVYPGRPNLVAVRATNTSSQNGNDRGLIGQLTVSSGDTVAALVVTDSSWRVSATEEAGWTDLTFDDTSWRRASEIANEGDPPWGEVLSTSSAKWIWSDLVPTSTTDKPNLETAYARRTFYFSVDGTSIESTPACP